MSRIITAACVLLVLLMSTAAPRAAPVQEPLREGDLFPRLEGNFLTGSEAQLPEAGLGKVALVAVGFSYGSRFPVEAWADRYRTTVGSRTDVTLFEVPMIGGVATLGRWFINRGMQNGTPAELHDNVITVYGRTGDWKKRNSYSPEHKDDAYLIVLDRRGIVRWLYHGAFDAVRSDELKQVLALLADGHPVETDPDTSDRRIDR